MNDPISQDEELISEEIIGALADVTSASTSAPSMKATKQLPESDRGLKIATTILESDNPGRC